MSSGCKLYEPDTIESHWQQYWEKNKTFRAVDFDQRPPYYILDMLPYPSGSGLHIGHPEGYTASDILTRQKRACGFNVLHPMGWDAFGLPAEQHAINTGVHPAINTQNNINTFRKQIKRFGFAIDWDREVDTSSREFYRWTQWIFLQLFKHGLAYVDERPVWWCQALGTVLSNEEIVNGKSERGSHPVERRNLRQWVLRITAYADKLLQYLDQINWPDSTKRQQIAWIGRSEGTDVEFHIDGHTEKYLTTFTTTPETLFGVTFMVIAPEHPYLDLFVTKEHRAAVEKYIEQAKHKSDLDRTDLAKHKTGVFTGGYVINPINQEKIPVWVADYVLISYGTGAVMGVPGHDERDFEFAQEYKLPIATVVTKSDGTTEAPYFDYYQEGSKLINSAQFNGYHPNEAAKAIADELIKRKLGAHTVNYKLRDWLFSRQRYWGEPFPITWVKKSDYEKLLALPNSELNAYLPKEPVHYFANEQELIALPVLPEFLPLVLPAVESYKPSGNGESPLANATEWLYVWTDLITGRCIEGRKKGDTAPTEPGVWVEGTRETNTMPQWAGSCWYYLRYMDPHNDTAAFDPKIVKYWGMPNFYIGGAEHAVLHLLYARFWHHFMYDIGLLPEPEPFQRLFHQGLILGEDGNKMSKSLGNTVNPDEIVAEYGADSVRLFEMFLGPLEDAKPWNMKGIEGVARFLKKVWRECISEDGTINAKIVDQSNESPETLTLLHQTIKKVTEDIENLRFNTAISQMMICVNHLQKQDTFTRSTANTFIQLLAPFAPHLGEELWERMGNQPTVSSAPWPKYDPAYLVEDDVQIAFQVNGKVRAEARVRKDTRHEDVIALAKSHEKVRQHLDGKSIVKEIYVPGKIVNLVVK